MEGGEAIERGWGGGSACFLVFPSRSNSLCEMWILFMCVRCGYFLCEPDVGINYVCQMWILFELDVDIV